jgi:epoxyqueuosine reductase
LDDIDLLALFKWTEAEFLQKTEGSPIRRIGYDSWQRNLAVGLGNAESSAEITTALQAKLNTASPLVKEHIAWALDQLAQ